MQELTSILLAHARQYPKMEPRDAVKLIYQNEFGGGHLITEEDACLQYLRREYEACRQIAAAPLMESIGSGIVRIHLCALDANGYTPERLCRDFIRSAATHTGNRESFLAKLEILTEVTRAGEMPFPPEALEAYLDSYAAAGYPPVSHSESYRAAYHPAYRVVDISCITTTAPESGAAAK